MLFRRQVLCLEVLAEEEGLVEVWPVGQQPAWTFKALSVKSSLGTV